MAIDTGAKPIKGTEGWYLFTRALAKTTPKALTRSRNARRGLRSLKGSGR